MTDRGKRNLPAGWLSPFSVCCCSLTLLGGIGFSGCSQPKTPKLAKSEEKNSSDLALDPIAKAHQLLADGNFEAAFTSATSTLLENPQSAEAKLIACEAQAGLGNTQAAVDLANSIEMDSPFAAKAAVIHVEQLILLDRSKEAADVALKAIERVSPVPIELHRTAWHVLNRVGRREEASKQADALCRSGKATKKEMASLIERAESFPKTLAQGQDPNEFFEPGLGIARWKYSQGDIEGALQELNSQFELGFESAAACAFFGRLLGETQRFENFLAWHSTCNANENDRGIKELGDYWAALGTLFLEQREFEGSTRALMEAVYRNPTDRNSLERLEKAFAGLDRSSESAQYGYRAKLQIQTEQLAPEPTSGESVFQHHKLTRMLLKLDRPMEAIQWTLLHLTPNENSQRESIERRRSKLQADANVLTLPGESSMLKIDRDQFKIDQAMESLVSNQKAVSKQTTSDAVSITAQPALENVAAEVGLDFQWYQDLKINLASIPIHESLGGGIGVLDYDLDGWPDFYLAQGSGEPPTDQCTRSNVLMRNLKTQFSDTTSLANASDHNYSSGIATGDVNQDGFPDIFIGSLGHNRLLLNNGDGTFTDSTSSLENVENEDRFTASVAIADINGDGLPELFEANYIKMEGGFALPDKRDDGREIIPSPTLHDADFDRWFVNLGDGSFQSQTISRDVAAPGTGLGVVITDFDGKDGNEIFVGNDVRPNHFLFHQTAGELTSGELLNAASVKGVANGYSGTPNGCMGIAAADFNRDGAIDLHITNYEKEPANLYLQTLSGAFADVAIRYRLEPLSAPYVGFGTKAVDFDRNGWMDLIVTNGHIFDLREDGREFFQMPPQLLMSMGRHFELANVDDASDYWSKQYLGRTIASLDFDQDGDIDFLVGHLDQPLALLQNDTRTSGNWIQIELIGSESERDAVGTRIVVSTTAGDHFTHWVTAGDGYLCSDEPMIDLGLGENSKIEKLQVHWPGGMEQSFENLKADRRYLIVEGCDVPHRR